MNRDSKPSSDGAFKKLVRSLSRSRPSQPNSSLPSPGPGTPGDNNRSPLAKNGKPGASPGLSTSPPPTSYFPPPPSEIFHDSEATGTRQRTTLRGMPSISSPGVSFAPSTATAARATSSPQNDEWAPAPRRAHSQSRAQQQQQQSATTDSSSRGGGRSRAQSAAVAGLGIVTGLETQGQGLTQAQAQGGAQGPSGQGQSGRRGVQLEDKPLSRKTSVARKVATAAGFVPSKKVEGEKRVLILVADGSEEIEVITPFDVCVRASLNPVLVSVSPQFSPSESLPYITLSRGARILADTKFEALKQEHKDDFDAVIIPGGAKGAERLSKDKGVQKLIGSFHESGKLVAMICAGSLAAKTSGIAEGQEITSHPSVKGDLEKHYEYSDERVVISNNLVTSRGPGTALEFSLAIVEILAGKRKRDEVAGPMML